MDLGIKVERGNCKEGIRGKGSEGEGGVGRIGSGGKDWAGWPSRGCEARGRSPRRGSAWCVRGRYWSVGVSAALIGRKRRRRKFYDAFACRRFAGRVENRAGREDGSGTFWEVRETSEFNLEREREREMLQR